jgi:hypothetical protein
LTALKSRFPSLPDSLSLFLLCVFPIHIWSLIAFLREVPGYVLRYTVWEMISILAYVQVFAFVETGLVLIILLALAFFLPRWILLDRFVAQGTLFVLVTTLWIVPIHYQSRIATALSLDVTGYLVMIWFWIMSYLAVLVGFSILLRRRDRFETGITGFVERLALLSVAYLLVDFASLSIVTIRNILLSFQ